MEAVLNKPASEMSVEELLALANQKQADELKKAQQRKDAYFTDKNNLGLGLFISGFIIIIVSINDESFINKTILMAENTSNEMKKLAKEEAENLINEAKKNASRIVNEALLEAEKTQIESIRLKKNIVLFKKKLKIILENQIEMVDEIDNIDL